jgi:hypothetical protein
MSVATTLRTGALALAVAACGSDDAELSKTGDSVGASDAQIVGTAPAAPAPCVPPPFRMPQLDTHVMRLSELGLYADMESKQTACDLLTWEPRFPLWSDGADKQRWLRLPAGTRIESADPEHLRFPVGAALFKEFARDGKRLETRLIARVTEDDTFFGAFVWRDDESDADLVRAGAANVRSTDHDVPNDEQCLLCHKGEPGRVLGLSSVQAPGFPPERLTHALPGLEVTPPALGYLHGNCGHCHNELGEAWRMAEMTLRLSVSAGAERLLGETLSVPASRVILGRSKRVVAGDPDASAVLARMQIRGAEEQMPPVASEHIDPRGVELVRAWITSLGAK